MSFDLGFTGALSHSWEPNRSRLCLDRCGNSAVPSSSAEPDRRSPSAPSTAGRVLLCRSGFVTPGAGRVGTVRLRLNFSFAFPNAASLDAALEEV
eukprot:CAMPEP_0181512854 /NCGR_PEP_ID=MMETSP1110-20121109/62195_1 /TAXON_ID=174948 /ORGANISM="Symbiodinium sp., Strain CCMP421" /LENGTH=94 /DNA_ID=CAMNT_0023642697 /DNA_START=190 /DNA_END=474 /DNA_ORIENTATION=-